jgi:hypothetical protein
MKSRIISKAIALAVLSLLLASGMQYFQTSRARMGREEYLAEAAERFDKHYEKPDSFVYNFIGFVFFGIPLLGLYEGVTWVVSKSLKGMDGRAKSQPKD